MSKTSKASKAAPAPEAPVTPEKRRELYGLYITNQIESTEIGIKRWTDGFMKDMVYSLEWADGTYNAVAELEVLKQLKALLDCDRTPPLTELLALAQREALYRACRTPASSSGSRNMINSYLTAAWAEAAHKLAQWTS